MHTREPGGTPLSEHVRDLLLHPKKLSAFKIGERSELLLFLASRMQHVEEKILPALRQGFFVICERFNDSTIAYQGYARHLGAHYVTQLCHLVCEGLIEPQKTLLLDLDPKEGLQRRKREGKSFDRLEREQLQFHQEVRQGFLHLADQYPERIQVIDASLPSDVVFFQALEILQSIL